MADHVDTYQKVRSAEYAARILRPMAGYVRSDWELTPAKREAVRPIMLRAAPASDGEKIAGFLDEAETIVVDFQIARTSLSSRKAALAELESLGQAITAIARSWSALGGELRGKLKRRMVERHTQSNKTRDLDAEGRIDLIVDARRRAGHIDEVLSEDIYGLGAEVDLIISALKDDRTRDNPFGHWCLWRLACAWRNATGALPSITRNASAVSGPQSSAFQDFVDEIVPSPRIGPGIVRDVVEAIKYAEENK